MRREQKKPLYRKVNTKARGVHHDFGGDYRSSRNNNTSTAMPRGVQRGLDYTPLFKFLLSKVGCHWDEIHSEAVARLDKQEPIYWMVATNSRSKNNYVRLGESSYFSGLFVDENNNLQVVAPSITKDTLEPLCSCCTHTFNGIPFTKKHTLKV